MHRHIPNLMLYPRSAGFCSMRLCTGNHPENQVLCRHDHQGYIVTGRNVTGLLVYSYFSTIYSRDM